MEWTDGTIGIGRKDRERLTKGPKGNLPDRIRSGSGSNGRDERKL